MATNKDARDPKTKDPKAAIEDWAKQVAKLDSAVSKGMVGLLRQLGADTRLGDSERAFLETLAEGVGTATRTAETVRRRKQANKGE